ncbi:MAG: mechanosensitive ion channel family protein [Candidatus Coatesbacteria bacterium]
MVSELFNDPWVILGCIAAALAAVASVLGILVERVLIPLALRHKGELDDRLAHAAKRALQALVFAGGLLMIVNDMTANPRIAGAHVTPYLHGLLLLSTAFAAAWLCTRLTEEGAAWYLERLSRGSETRLDQQLMPAVRWVSRLAYFFFALTAVLGAYNIKVTALLGAAGVISLAIALAAQEMIANVIGGLAIMVDRPFRVGDRIELPDSRGGFVRTIGLRSTRIETLGGTLLVVPNADLVKQSITNYARPDGTLVVRQTIGVGYSTDVERARRLILDAVGSHPEVAKTPPPAVYFTEFGDSALQLVIEYTIARYERVLDVRSEVNIALKTRLEAGGIDIPFPQRVVHLRKDAGG